MELKKDRIRKTINDLRRFWIFESDSDKIKLEKFKEVNKMMKAHYKWTRQEKEVSEPEENQMKPMAGMKYNCGISYLASNFKIARSEFILKKIIKNY